jgi:D-alanyl-D-alanine carboxypeptidase/D-alanyl-D-alanine-endopeptidase (penicillin-binding protein 4)
MRLGSAWPGYIERAGGSVKGKISTGTVPEGLEPIYVHRQSRTLSEILVELLRRLAEHGATTKEIAAVSGHRTLAEIERYTA